MRKIYSDSDNIVYDMRNSKNSIFRHISTGYVLDEDIVFGKDYPTGSFDYDLYQILRYLKNEPDIDRIFDMYNTKSIHGEKLLREILISKEYITPLDGQIQPDIREKLSSMSAGELSFALRKKGIKTSGKKKKLLKIALEKIKYLDFEGSEFEIAENGEKFLSEYDWIEIYDFCLEKFEFDDFYKFFDEHDYSDSLEMTLGYLKAHTTHAHEVKDFRYLTDCMSTEILAYIWAEDYYNSIISSMKYFIMKVNPLYDFKDHYTKEPLLEYPDVEHIETCCRNMKIDVDELFGKVWDSIEIEKEYTGKEDALKLLKELFNENDFDEICSDYLNQIC